MDILEERVEILGGEYELDVPKLVKVVQDRGFTAKSLKIKAIGTVEKTEGRYTFVVGKTNLRFPLIQNDVLKQLLNQPQNLETPFSILGRVVIPPPKSEEMPGAPVGSLIIERFVFVMTGM
ncbi:MAG: hypothetical protein IIA45_14265 [Bacteroidetes bacterium]|nr:hypothetical protein [Bacteroidota bacterium]